MTPQQNVRPVQDFLTDLDDVLGPDAGEPAPTRLSYPRSDTMAWAADPTAPPARPPRSHSATDILVDECPTQPLEALVAVCETRLPLPREVVARGELAAVPLGEGNPLATIFAVSRRAQLEQAYLRQRTGMIQSVAMGGRVERQLFTEGWTIPSRLPVDPGPPPWLIGGAEFYSDPDLPPRMWEARYVPAPQITTPQLRRHRVLRRWRRGLLTVAEALDSSLMDQDPEVLEWRYRLIALTITVARRAPAGDHAAIGELLAAADL